MEAYIVAGYRSAVGKAKKGGFRFYRPDDLAADVVKHLVASVPQLDPSKIDDLICGNAIPEAEQGMQIGRMVVLRAGLPLSIGGVTVNRYCASGLETIAMATAKIKAGMAECIIAGGVESMSLLPMTGWRTVLNYEIAKNTWDYYSSMGLTAEAVSKQFNVTREQQDTFAFHSHQKAIKAIEEGKFKDEIVPINIEEIYLDANNKRKTRNYIVDTDEGPRKDTTIEGLGKLKAVFDAKGSVTAGNSSQTSDGAAFVIVMSEKMVKELNIEPIARIITSAVVGCEPRIMGIGPVVAIPQALKQAGLKQSDIEMIELNEAFAAQSLAVIKELGLNPDIINPNGGAIALGHPLGCSGAKLSIQLINEMRRQNKKYGMVSACIGGGQGIAGIIERLK
ncbi:MAG TPA: acetyl-CoA C-acyltransferase [Chitinophagales bacterium]|nr:acetyl-CoA C-acyltransferase [Chitinophagales bacterium]MCB0511978.1 acetyl-CoA C-acyltransferase [Bacteroidota bacterium]HMU98063.1 acetyl-CoA C-acyltransferase [Chitinophagales bacterium]HMV03553.1 acetyl-CoA C-acyltransferase [Chitinophagales bacterium]HMW94584.1 acetyl-CoA C-acyltransferase [Chitinophagales bacterium]